MKGKFRNNQSSSSRHPSSRKRLFFALCFAVFSLFLPTLSMASAVVGGTVVAGEYSVNFETGDGNSYSSGLIGFNASPADPLAFTQGHNGVSGFQAWAGASLWGQGSSDFNWGVWVTDGTGVSQYDPNHVTDDPATLTVDYNFTVSGGDAWSNWIDYWYLAGVVGEGGEVGFNAGTVMVLYDADGNEIHNNGIYYEYLNDTPGSFSIFSGAFEPIDPITQPLAGGWMEFTGTMTYWAKNDGGPSSIYFKDPSVTEVPEPATMLLLGLGLFGLAGLRRRFHA